MAEVLDWWHAVLWEKSLFYNSIFFPPTLLLLLKLFSFQEVFRTRQHSKWVCANTAFWARAGSVVSSFPAFSVKTLRIWNSVIDIQKQALLIMDFSQVSGKMEELSSICKMWKCTWPGQRVSIAFFWGCLDFQDNKGHCPSSLQVLALSPPCTLTSYFASCQMPACMLRRSCCTAFR